MTVAAVWRPRPQHTPVGDGTAIRPAPADNGDLLLNVTLAGFLSRNADAARKNMLRQA